MTDTTIQPLVSLKHVDKLFGDNQVLYDINLDVAPGEVVVLVGPGSRSLLIWRRATVI